MLYVFFLISGPQLVITVRGSNWRGSTHVCGYGVLLTPPTCGTRVIETPLLKPRLATLLGEWFGWITGRVPELVDPKMLASGKDNYCKFILQRLCVMYLRGKQ